MSSIHPSEHQIQCSIIEYANNVTLSSFGYVCGNFKFLGEFIFSIPNGGKRNIATGAFLKKEGLVRGVTDLFLMIPSINKKYNGFFIEVKTRKGCLSIYQQNFRRKVLMCGYAACVVRSLDDFIKIIDEYFKETIVLGGN